MATVFKDLGIKPQKVGLEGDKLKMDRILNREIKVEKFTIEDSKYSSGKCLYMQFELNGNRHVVFSGSVNLIDMIQRVPASAFPFTTKIVKTDNRLDFT